MEGPYREGHFIDPDSPNRWVSVEKLYYPRERFVARSMRLTETGLKYVDTNAPELTEATWQRLQGWL